MLKKITSPLIAIQKEFHKIHRDHHCSHSRNTKLHFLN